MKNDSIPTYLLNLSSKYDISLNPGGYNFVSGGLR